MLSYEERMPTRHEVHLHCVRAARDQRRALRSNATVSNHQMRQAWDILDPTPAADRPPVSEIIRVTAAHYKVNERHLVGGGRTLDVVKPRQVAMYVARYATLHSLTRIGKFFGGRDHTTVLHAVRRVEAKVVSDPAVAADIEAIEREVMR